MTPNVGFAANFLQRLYCGLFQSCLGLVISRMNQFRALTVFGYRRVRAHAGSTCIDVEQS